jgi:TonB family protein
MDSPMVNKDHTIAPVADSDKAKMVAIATPVKATPNPAKKGMKLKVMITLPLMGEGAMVADKEGYYINTEVLPSYPGGEKELQRFFEKNIEYPADAEDNGIEGTVKLNFAVDENGKIYSPIVTTPNIGYGVEQEALRVFSKMPAWTPGKIKGKNVKTRFTLPVTFKLF